MQPSPDERTAQDTRPTVRPGRARRRALLVAMPLLLVAACTLDLFVRGRDAITMIASNLPTPLVSTGARIVDLVHATAPEGRVYDVVVAPEAAAPAMRAAGARAQLRLESRGGTRILVVQPESASASRLAALGNVLAGRARLQIVDDRNWVDLGALPADGSALRVHVIGLLPATFAFAELNEVAGAAPAWVDVTIVPSGTRVVRTMPHLRLVRAAPVPATELLRRVTFFARTSVVLLTAALLAVSGLCAGWALLGGTRTWAGCALLVASVTLLHAALLPPLQGADETSQVGTIEWLVTDPSPARAWRYPQSIARVTRAIEQDRVQYHASEPLPLGDADARAHLALVLRSPLQDAARDAPTPPAADLQVVELRAPLFFAAYPPLRGAFLRLPVLDRIAAYRLIATLWGLLGFVAGLVLLRAARLPREVGLAYALAFTLPYVVGVVATCSNYAPAIGLGFLIAAAGVTTILGPTPGMRRLSGVIALAAAWAGVPLWPDFLALAVVASSIAAAALASLALHRARASQADGGAQPARAALIALALVAAAAALAWRGFPVFNYDLRRHVAAWDAAQLAVRGALVAAPMLFAAGTAAFFWSLRGLPVAACRRRTHAASAAIALVLIAAFAITPHAEVPYEHVFLPLTDLVRAHVVSFLASSFSFDQDRLGWKFLFGTFGWHDVYYPEAVYAAARWGLTLFLIALPLLGRGFAVARPKPTVALLALAGIGGSLAAATLLARHAMSVHPHGRFALPYVALVALPVLALVATRPRRRSLRIALRCAVALNVWTAIALLGARYYLWR